MNTDHSKKFDVYVNYPGHCEEAFRFYEQHLGGRITNDDCPPASALIVLPCSATNLGHHGCFLIKIPSDGLINLR